jgi:hypothetical protein
MKGLFDPITLELQLMFGIILHFTAPVRTRDEISSRAFVPIFKSVFLDQKTIFKPQKDVSLHFVCQKIATVDLLFTLNIYRHVFIKEFKQGFEMVDIGV